MSINHSHVFGFTPKAIVRQQTRKHLEVARNRLILKASILILALLSIVGRLVHLVVFQDVSSGIVLASKKGIGTGRAEILDMNGEPLASTIITASLATNPQKLDNVDLVIQRLCQALPKLDKKALEERLKSDKPFVWILRHLSPKQQAAVLKLGIPGLELLKDEKRIYPYGRLLAHVVGMTNIDNEGIAGVEMSFNKTLAEEGKPVRLSIDVRAQEIAREELIAGIKKFSADAGNAIVVHLATGEIRAMVSLPDFQPSKPEIKNQRAMFNRNIVGVYEMGSTMKIINAAMSLSSGAITVKTKYDTSEPLSVGRFRITDFRGKNTWLTVPEVIITSSNIGSGRMAIAAGIDAQKDFFKKIGFLEPASLEVHERGYPLYPRHWTEASLITISYGYGISVTPLHLARAVSSIIHHGQEARLTLIQGGNKDFRPRQILDPKTSQQIRAMLRLTVTDGTTRKADVNNYCVLGKSGTANRRQGKGYQTEFVDTCFVGAIGVDVDNPEYVVVVMLENPKRLKETFGFNNAGWNAAPVGGEIMRRLAVLYGIEPNREVHTERFESSIMKLVSYQRPLR